MVGPNHWTTKWEKQSAFELSRQTTISRRRPLTTELPLHLLGELLPYTPGLVARFSRPDTPCRPPISFSPHARNPVVQPLSRSTQRRLRCKAAKRPAIHAETGPSQSLPWNNE